MQTLKLFEDVSYQKPTLLSADFPVRELAMRDLDSGLRMSEADSGLSTSGSFAKYDPATSSLKTSQLCWDGEAQEFCATLPEAGMMRNGILYELPISDSLISENEFLSLPTPTRVDYKGGCNKPRKNGGSPRESELKHYLKIRFGGTYPNPSFLEAIMGFPIGWGVLKGSETP